MPGHKEHIMIGAVATAILLFIVHKFQYLIPWVSTELEGLEWIVLALVVYLFSQIPDVDADTSVINKIWNTTAGLVGLYCLYTGQYRIFGLFAIASIVVLEWVKHRGICHNEFFVIGLAAPLIFVNPLWQSK